MTEPTNVTPAFFRLFDGVVDAYLIGDADDSLVFANRSARQLLRRLGPKPGDDIPTMFADPGRLKDLFTIARSSGDPTPVRATLRADDVSTGAHAADDDNRESRELLLEVSGRRLDGRSLLLIRCRLSSQANEQFEAVNKRLAMEGELRRVSQARLGMERAYRSLDRFASVAAHDLKAPARHLSNLSMMITESLGDRIDDDDAALLQHINKSATRLQSLVDDIYEFAKSVDSTVATASVSLPALIGDVSEDLREEITETDAQIIVGDLPAVQGHQGQLHRLAQNLIQNAIKYKHPERPPVVDVSATTENDGSLLLKFADNGQGFDEQYAEKIFEPFARVSDDREIEGSGLGLAACLAIVSAHGWQISAESEPGQGSVFIITLPAASLAP